jgi:hypothetical protein
MKLGVFLATLLLAVVCWMAPATAANPGHLSRLLETGECPGCDLSNADLHGADLRGANLQGANLEGADLSDTIMMAVNLRDTNLQGANLSKADMLLVDLQRANLKGATTEGIDMRALRLCNTISPSGEVSDRDCNDNS